MTILHKCATMTPNRTLQPTHTRFHGRIPAEKNAAPGTRRAGPPPSKNADSRTVLNGAEPTKTSDQESIRPRPRAGIHFY